MNEKTRIAYAAILWEKAFQIYGPKITPAGKNKRFRDAITVFRNKIILWYNFGESTHIVQIQKLTP